MSRRRDYRNRWAQYVGRDRPWHRVDFDCGDIERTGSLIGTRTADRPPWPGACPVCDADQPTIASEREPFSPGQRAILRLAVDLRLESELQEIAFAVSALAAARDNVTHAEWLLTAFGAVIDNPDAMDADALRALLNKGIRL